MTAGSQCDNCRTFAPSHPPGWFYVAQQPGEEAVPSLAAALFGKPSEPLTFCSVKCLSEWAYVRNAASEAAAP